MRLHLLRLRAFGPFATEQSIDFDRVGAGGLFLLDGPTGAGKTSVLDAVTFALYGPGDRNGDDRLHSDFAAPGVEPEVMLEFSVRGRRHRVTRTPEFERPKRRGTGTTKQSSSVHLERFEGRTWRSRSSNKAEVGDLLAEEIGLSRDQFRQVVLLPQGEFATFLRAGDDERRTLLTKLFGTHLYDRITEELDRRRVEAVKDLDVRRAALQTAVAAAAAVAGLGADPRAELVSAAPADLDPALDAVAAELSVRHESARGVAAGASTQLVAAREAHTQAVGVRDRVRRFVAAAAALTAHEGTRPEHDRQFNALAAARRAEPVRSLVDAAREAEQNAEQARAAVLELDPGAGPTRLAGDGADLLAARASAAALEAAGLRHLVERETGRAELHSAVRVATSALAEAREELERLTDRQDELPVEIERADTAIDAARRGAQGRELALRERTQAQEQLVAAQHLAELEGQCRAAAEAHALARDAHQRSVDEHQRLLDARLSGIATELADALHDGEPCAVCGATEHPAPAQPALDAVTAEHVAAAANAREQAQQRRDSAASVLQELETARTANGTLAKGRSVLEIETELVAVTRAIAVAEAYTEQLSGLLAAKQVRDAESQAISRQHAAALTAVATAEAALVMATREHDGLAAEIAAAAGGSATVAGRQAQLQREADRGQALAAAVGALAAATQAQTKATQRAEREALARGFPDLDAAALAVRSESEQAALQSAVDAWQADSERLQAATSTEEFTDLPIDLSADRQTHEAAAQRAGERAAEAAAVLARAEHASQVVADSAEVARHALVQFADRRIEVDGAKQELAERELQSEPVVYLAKLTRGMTGQRRVALTTYVLRHWFERVVQAANLRLAGMSSGRYELLRVDEGGSKSERTGLTLQVVDRHTGEQRSTRSLSGGETFYTSLALALGLADVVKAEAGGADLDTLFIDEGFGSLDADTLEEVMSVIDDLRDRGRVVGIVSHVADLKDRIAEHIEVRRIADGSSVLTVVA